MDKQKTIFHFFSVSVSVILILGFVPASFSESELKTVMIFVDPPNNDEIPIQEEKNKNENSPTPYPVPTFPQELPTSFITGNNYALNSNPVLISTTEGIELNNLLIDQIAVWQDDAEHTEQFWSRTDQVIMGNFGIVNALQNPFTENNYHISGEKHTENTHSNLKYFVQERGYDLDNLENVPNHMVTPKKYDLSRVVSKQIQNPLSNNLDIQHVRDLRDVAPNAFDFTPEQQMQMFRESVKSTSFEVVGSLMPKLIVDESMFLPESESDTSKNNLENSLMNKENNSFGAGETESKYTQQEKKQEQEMFQQTNHIKDLITDSSFETNYTTQKQQEFPLFEILFSTVISIVSVSALYIVNKYYRKPAKQIPLITINQKYNYLSDVESLLHEAESLYKNSQIKNAYEKLSESIRLFYSNKLDLEKEVVTSDLIRLMKNFNESEKSLIKYSLHLSDMIKFAKHSEITKQFDIIVKEFIHIIRNEQTK